MPSSVLQNYVGFFVVVVLQIISALWLANHHASKEKHYNFMNFLSIFIT